VQWVAINNGLTLALPADRVDNDSNGILNDATETGEGATRIRLAIGQSTTGNGNPIYAALIGGGQLMGVFTSTPTGPAASTNDKTQWTQGAWSLVGNAAVAPAPVNAVINRGNFASGAAATTQVTLASVGATTTITRTTGDWRADGFTPGQDVTLATLNAAGGANAAGINRTAVRIISVNATVLTIAANVPCAGAACTPTVYLAMTKTAAGVPGLNITGRAETPPNDPKQQPQPNLGLQGDTHFALVADASGNLFIAGDAGLDAAGFPANVWLYTTSTKQWTTMVDQTSAAAVHRPHADTPRWCWTRARALGTPL